MLEKRYETPEGAIVYWVNRDAAAWEKDAPALIFLPGLTADHRLFDQQVAFFEESCPLLVWDAPGHRDSRPFALSFSLVDKARWLHAILQQEGIGRFVLVGQSMGAYVSQAFLQEFPGEAAGFVSIDSAPLQRCYYSGWELWLLKHMEPVFRWYPRSWLLSQGTKGNAETAYGQELMLQFLETYTPQEYAALAGHGFRILAEAVERALPYAIDCPAMLMCGEYDKAGSTRRYNRAWTQKSGLPLVWVPGAGHNSNTDNPAFVNEALRNFVETL